MSKFKIRIEKLSQFLKEDQSLLLSLATDISYFTGFNDLVPEERESFLFVTPNSHIFFHASFSPFNPPAGINTNPGCALRQVADSIEKVVQKSNFKKLLVDKSNLSVFEYEKLAELTSLKLLGFDRQHVWKLRTIKDRSEIKILRKTAHATAEAMAASIKSLQVGMTERQLKKILESELQKAGAKQPSFPTIVAFGANSALPHHQPTDMILTPEMPVLIDMGARLDGYNGDMTRTVWFGHQPSEEFLKIEKVVKNAYRGAFNLLNNRHQNHILAKELDHAARNIIAKAGYAKEFIHTTGHGLGLDLHENLSLNWNNSQPILPDMVITIEPGIYLKGKFGYRYENMILVTNNGAEELTF